MTRTLFTVRTLTTRMRRARRHARMPEWAPEGWSIHPTDPATIVAAFARLRVRPEYQLVAYQYRAMGNGNAVVYALPSDLPVPEPEACPRDESQWLTPPVPPHALPDVRLALEGNGTPASYMSASLAYRELCEMGTAWHGASWSHHTLLGQDPRSGPEAQQALSRALHGSRLSEFTWHVPTLPEWAPHVEITNDDVVVRLVTASAAGTERIVLHEDRYSAGSLVFESSYTEVATGSEGYVC